MKTKKTDLGCLSILILFALFFFIMSTLIVFGTALFNSDELSGDNTYVSGMKLFGITLIVLYLIFYAKGGKWYKINLGGYGDDDFEKKE